MLLNKTNKCTCGSDGCNCNKQETNEGLENSKELLGSYNEKIPVLETSGHEYKVIKKNHKENLLLS